MNTPEQRVEKFTFQAISLEELQKLDMSKVRYIEQFEPQFSYDTAVPQSWLNNFANWCETHKPKITYHLILSTVVWSYERTHWGMPNFICTETFEAFCEYLDNQPTTAEIHPSKYVV